jgi:hypothetical protein
MLRLGTAIPRCRKRQLDILSQTESPRSTHSIVCLRSALQPLLPASANSVKTDIMEGATDYEDENSLVAETGEKRREIAELLKRYSASYINSYGMFSIEAL